MTVLYRILRAIDDGLFDRVFHPLLDRTGSTPARLAPAMVGAAFAAFLARILLLHRAGHLAEGACDPPPPSRRRVPQPARMPI